MNPSHDQRCDVKLDTVYNTEEQMGEKIPFQITSPGQDEIQQRFVEGVKGNVCCLNLLWSEVESHTTVHSQEPYCNLIIHTALGD